MGISVASAAVSRTAGCACRTAPGVESDGAGWSSRTAPSVESDGGRGRIRRRPASLQTSARIGRTAA